MFLTSSLKENDVVNFVFPIVSWHLCRYLCVSCVYAVRNAVASRGNPAVLAAGGKWAAAQGKSSEDLQLLVMVGAYVKKEE